MNFLGSSARVKQNTLCVSVLFSTKLRKQSLKNKHSDPIQRAVAVLFYKINQKDNPRGLSLLVFYGSYGLYASPLPNRP